jgi:hypothetical protein
MFCTHILFGYELKVGTKEKHGGWAVVGKMTTFDL